MSQIRLRYGSYTHSLSEAAVSIRRNTEFNDSGNPYANREMWDIQGRLEADTQDELTTAIQNLEAAYNQQAEIIQLEFENGNATAHRINANDTVDGIRVVAAPSFLFGTGAEYSTYRTYNISVEATIRTNPSVQQQLVLWEEYVETRGGFPRDILVETLNTLPVKQRVADHTIATVLQTGRAIGLNGWPLEARILLPDAAIFDNSVGRSNPQTTMVGGRMIEALFETRWNYVMGIQVPIQFRPTPRPMLPVFQRF